MKWFEAEEAVVSLKKFMWIPYLKDSMRSKRLEMPCKNNVNTNMEKTLKITFKILAKS